MSSKAKGYRVERKIRLELEKRGWLVVRAGGSLGEADLICLKAGKCLLLQVKSTKKDVLYYYGPKQAKIAGFPFYLVVDFGYGNVRVVRPRRKVKSSDGVELKTFLK